MLNQRQLNAVETLKPYKENLRPVFERLKAQSENTELLYEKLEKARKKQPNVTVQKLEKQIEKTQDEKGKELIKKCLAQLENETPLCNVEFTEEELVIMTELAPLSLKPTVVLEKATDTNEMIKMVLEKAAIVLFYTTAKGELKSWPVKKGSDIVTCASKIHTDLAKGFIRAEVVNYSDFVTVPNMHEAQEKGIVKIVGKDYSIKDGDIIEIRFNV